MSPTPQASHHLPDPPLLLSNLLLRLAARIPATINLHGSITIMRAPRCPMTLLFHNLMTIHALRPGIDTHHTIHHEAPALAQLVDSTHCIDRAVQGAAGVEVFLDSRQEVFAGAELACVVGRADPGVLQGFVGGHALLRVDCKTAADEIAGFLGYTAPVFEWREGVVGGEDGLHFFQVGVAVERGVPAEKEIGDHANGPDVAFFSP